MRNIKKEAEAVLAADIAFNPPELLAAALDHAAARNFAWWETAFLIDETERLSGVLLNNPFRSPSRAASLAMVARSEVLWRSGSSTFSR